MGGLSEIDFYRAKVKSVVPQLSATNSFLTREVIINYDETDLNRW